MTKYFKDIPPVSNGNQEAGRLTLQPKSVTPNLLSEEGGGGSQIKVFHNQSASIGTTDFDVGFEPSTVEINATTNAGTDASMSIGIATGTADADQSFARMGIVRQAGVGTGYCAYTVTQSGSVYTARAKWTTKTADTQTITWSTEGTWNGCFYTIIFKT